MTVVQWFSRIRAIIMATQVNSDDEHLSRLSKELEEKLLRDDDDVEKMDVDESQSMAVVVKDSSAAPQPKAVLDGITSVQQAVPTITDDKMSDAPANPANTPGPTRNIRRRRRRINKNSRFSRASNVFPKSALFRMVTPFGTSIVVCFVCGLPGHYSYTCPFRNARM